MSLAHPGPSRLLRPIFGLALAVGCAGPAGREARPASGQFRAPRVACELLGERALGSGLRVDDTVLGGLSGLSYDPERDLFYALSDDRSVHGPARFYTLRLPVSPGGVSPGEVEVVGWTLLEDADGQPFAPRTVDPEGIALSATRTLLVASEGDVSTSTPPFLREYALSGKLLRELPLPAYYLPDGAGASGIRPNLGFEGVALSRDGTALVAATENALAQDGPDALGDGASPCRILWLSLASGQTLREAVYLLEPLGPAARDGLVGHGLVDLLALDADRLLVLERSYSETLGPGGALYVASASVARDVTGRVSLAPFNPSRVRPMPKLEILDLKSAGVTLDNFEGMSWGPRLNDGRRTLILVSDDNFSASQRTRFAFLALSDG